MSGRPKRTQALKGAWSVAVAAAALVGVSLQSREPAPNLLPFKPAFKNQTRAPHPTRRSVYAAETIASGLDHPWSLAFLPNGHMLITERNGTMRIVTPGGEVSDPIKGLPALHLAGGHGLADVVLDPRFPENRVLYFTHFAPPAGQAPRAISNDEMNAWLRRPVAERLKDPLGMPRVARARLSGDEKTIEDVSIILDGADRRLVFGRDGTLFAMAETHTSGGVSFVDDLPQRLDNPFGKVLRIHPDGSIPRDNPFVGKAGALPEIYAIGVRDAEGAAIEPSTGRLWINEHGVKGGDELNVIRPGANYGFPVITYGIEYNDEPIGRSLTQKAGMEQPVYFWNPDIAPSGLMFYTGNLFPEWKGDLFLGSLLGRHLVRLRVRHDRVVFEEQLLTERGKRIRDVRLGPDEALYVLTDEDNGELLKVVPRR